MKNLKRILSFFIVMSFMFVMFGFRVGVKATDESFDWNLASATYSSADENSAEWTNSVAKMTVTKNGSSYNVNEYLGGVGENKHTRFYNKHTITFSILDNQYQINSIEVKTTGSDYATNFKDANWTNASTSTNSTVLQITPTIKTEDVVAVLGKSTRITKITVYYSEVTDEMSIDLTGSPNNILVGNNNLTLTATPNNINPSPASFTWISSNPSVATVSNSGVVTGVSMGVAEITASSNEVSSDPYEVSVWPSNASNISVETAISIAQFAGTTNSAFKYTTSGTVTEVNGDNFTLSDGNNTINVYRTNNNLSANDQVVVNGNLRMYNSEPQYQSPTIGYTVIFDLNGGSGSFTPLTGVNYNTKINNPGTPTRDGYTFAGWFNGDNQWDFNTNVVTSPLTLTAHWISNGVDDAINTQVSTINAYMSMAYKYTFGSAPTSNTYIKATGVSQLSSGDTVIIVSKAKDGSYYAVTNSINASRVASRSSTLEIIDNVITSEISSSFVWTLSGNAKDGWALKNGDKYIDNGTNADMVLGDLEVKEFIFKSDETNSYFLNNGTRAIFDNGTGFKNYAISNLGTNNYATEIYVFVKQSSVNKTYRDVDFRLMIAVDDGITSVLSGLSLEGKWGIEVTAGDTTVKYDCDGEYIQTIVGKKYVVVDLGDMLNEQYDKITTNFTARAYVLYNGNYYYSTKTKTYSIKSMLDNYYGEPATTSIVEGLVQALEGYGYTFSNE